MKSVNTQETFSYEKLSYFLAAIHAMENREYELGNENALLLHKIRTNMYYAGIREDVVIGDDLTTALIPLTKDEWLTLGGQLQKRASLSEGFQSRYLWEAARVIRRFLYANFQLTSSGQLTNEVKKGAII
jgi:hypothetical protein